MSESWMKKHARNLLSTMPVDNKASALHNHGPVDPKTGKKTHPIGEQLDPKAFTRRTDPNAAATDESEASIARRRKSNAIKAAKNKAARYAKTPAGRREARDKANKTPRSTIKLNKKK